MMTTTTDKDLRGKIAAAETHQLEVAAERDEVAYNALVLRDREAIKRLDALNAELARVSTEIASLKAALAESGRRSAAAAAEQRDTTERSNAEKALALLDTFAKRGAVLDAKFDEAIAEYAGLFGEFRELEKLGFSPTTYRMVAITMRTARS
jgi:hypothetical protein